MNPSDGNLRVWWCPQIPMKSFTFSVSNLVEARLLLNVLAEYDVFQLENLVKPDFSNGGGLSVFDALDDTDGPHGSWVDWHDDDGNDIDHYWLDTLRQREVDGELPRWEMADHPQRRRAAKES